MRGGAAAATLLVVLGLALAAEADVLRLEAVGAVPIRGGAARISAPKQAAIQAALREAVSRVAHDLLIDTDPAGASGGLDSRLAQLAPALGSDMLRYTTSFRILDDRGERPSLFVEDPGAATEYVVILEVNVDADRVAGRLVEAGLLAPSRPQATAGRVRLEVLGLHQYGAYQELESLLLKRLRARSVAPLELERGRAVLSVETVLSPADLLHRLLAVAPANMEIAPLGGESDEIRLSVYWTPAAGKDAVAAPDAGAAPRSRRR